jgi:hypothetical protein
MDMVFRNIEKLKPTFANYELLYNNSIRLKQYYKLLAKHYSEKMHYPIQLNVGLDIDEPSDLNKIFAGLHSLKEYYQALQSKKISLSDEKVFSKYLTKSRLIFFKRKI